MSAHPSSGQGKRPKGGGGRQSCRGGGRVKVYLHAVTDEQAALLTDTVNTRPLEEVKKNTGADIQFDTNPSPVPGMKILIISGLPSQIEAAVGLISQKTGLKVFTQDPLPDQAQTFWLQWVEAAFPDLDSRAYFLPPVYGNRVPMTRQSAAGQEVLVLQSATGQAGQSNQVPTSSSSAAHLPISQPPRVQDSDVRDDAAMQRIFVCLQKMFEENKDVMVGLTQLQFGQYLGEPCYTAAAAHLPRPSSLPASLPQSWKQGDFNVLLIHRLYGLVVCEVKAVGDNIKAVNMSQQDVDNNIRQKLSNAVSQLDKAEAMLSHLVSDIAPGLRITKVIAFPNLTTRQLQQAISGDSLLIQDLCRCLGTTDPSNIPGLCLCCDQLSDPKTPCDVSSHVLSELRHWWQRRVAGAGPDSHMTSKLYKTLVARFCGPATTVTVPCTCPPRVSVKTLGQAVWWTGECYTAVIALFPEQVHLLHTAPPTLFVTGPPGTGKTVVLLLMVIQWLRCGHHVYVVSTWRNSRAACVMLYHLLLQSVKTQQSAGVSTGQPHLLQYDLFDGEDVEKAINDLSQAATGGSLYVIADEVTSDNFACTSDKGISSSKSKQSSEWIPSNDSGNDTIQFNYPSQPEANYFEECEKRKQHLLNKPLREHQVGDDLVDPSNKSTSSSKEKQWIELFPLNDSGKDRIQDDKDERESQRNASCGDSPDDLNNDDLSLAKSPNLKLSVEQDKKEFSGDIDKASSLRRRRLHSDSEYPRDSERNRESFALRSLPVD